LTTDIVETSTSELVQDAVAQMGKAGKAGVVLSMELARGQSATFAVEIDAELRWELAGLCQIAMQFHKWSGYQRC